MTSDIKKFLNEMNKKEENDSNSYSKINSELIKKLGEATKEAKEVMGKKVITKEGKSKDLFPASGKDVKILKGEN